MHWKRFRSFKKINNPPFLLLGGITLVMLILLLGIGSGVDAGSGRTDVTATDNGNGGAAAAEKPVRQEPASRWQYLPLHGTTETASGFDGLAFTDSSAADPDAPFFRLTEDSDTGIWHGYVPAEMKGPLRVRLGDGEYLRIAPADSGDPAPGENDEEAESGTDGGGSGTETAESSGNTETGDTGNGKSAAEAADFLSGDTLPVFEEGAHFAFTILDAEGQSLGTEEVVFHFTENIPSMYIETESGSMKAVNDDRHHETSEAAAYRIYLTGGTPDSGGRCRIKGRGNSTWSQKKRPYNLNLDEENVLLGMDSCKKYALIANYWDSTQTRQYYAFLAAERLGLACTPQTQFVNLYLNGRYQSLYLLTQRINVNGGTVSIANLDKANKKANEKQLTELAREAEARTEEAAGGEDPVTEEIEQTEDPLPERVVMCDDGKGHEAAAYAWENDPSDISGGYLLEFQNRYKDEDVWFETETLHISFKSPETPSVGEYEYIAGYVREAEKALFAEDWTNPDTGMSCFDYFDMDSWARMYLIQDFFVQSDDEFYSFFFYKKEGDPLLYCGPVWDFDLCLGNMNCGDYYKTSAQTLWLKDGRKKWLHRMEQHPEFSALLAKIYLKELEPIIRNLLEKEYDATVSRLETDTNLNYIRWHKNLNYRERTGLVRSLLETRVQFLHEYYTDPSQFHRLLFHFAWDDFSYYVKDGESMGFLPTREYGEKQSTPQSNANGTITGWQDPVDGSLLRPDEPILKDREFDPVYAPE
ncbi:MAG: CotH kinase family protein [Eubacteriales bacterium]|nr:CotH kinase family protein [Eubacteriales bacterium]